MQGIAQNVKITLCGLELYDMGQKTLKGHTIIWSIYEHQKGSMPSLGS